MQVIHQSKPNKLADYANVDTNLKNNIINKVKKIQSDSSFSTTNETSQYHHSSMEEMESLPTQPHSRLLFRQVLQNDMSSYKAGTIEIKSHYKRKFPHSSSLSSFTACFRRRFSSAHFSPMVSGFPDFKNRPQISIHRNSAANHGLSR